MSRSENDTRLRLLEAGWRLFAERGFRKVTVREICREAGANVAAVNYHFQDKEGLYRAVLEQAIARMRETTDLSLRAPEGSTPDERLRTAIRTTVGRTMGRGNDGRVGRLLRHEFENPTEALDRVVERAIRPRMRALAELVAGVIGCGVDDPRVGPSVASVHAQLMLSAPLWHTLGDRIRMGQAQTAEELGHHIAEFSIGGLVAIRGARSDRRSRRQSSPAHSPATSGTGAAQSRSGRGAR